MASGFVTLLAWLRRDAKGQRYIEEDTSRGARFGRHPASSLGWCDFAAAWECLPHRVFMGLLCADGGVRDACEWWAAGGHKRPPYIAVQMFECAVRGCVQIPRIVKPPGAINGPPTID